MAGVSIIATIANYLAGYSALAEGAPLWVNYLGSEPTEYAVIPLPGEKRLSVDILDRETREYPFAFQSVESTADNAARLANVGFFEAFADWMEEQTEAGTLPGLGAKRTAIKIEALTWGYLFEQGESGTAVYQINCRLVYEQVP